MSRIGSKPIPVPKGVKVDLNGLHVKVTGPKGTLERDIRPEIELVASEGNILVKTKDISKRTVAFSGLTRTLVDNMVQGVEHGFKKNLLIEGVGYRAEASGKDLILHVGYSNPVQFKMPEGVSVLVEKNKVTLESIDKELLGLTAARIREVRKPEPYKGKGIRYADEHVVRKVGKSAGK
ncbi:MAG: 50S ribosomal protein L6 [Proteobacteria bacterium]|nr:50S ribosomal protein L6 [Pseudomonadota bacterium]MBU1710052.1 50S ribosomal protein L6 [Pseudomonadota bacterium]